MANDYVLTRPEGESTRTELVGRAVSFLDGALELSGEVESVSGQMAVVRPFLGTASDRSTVYVVAVSGLTVLPSRACVTGSAVDAAGVCIEHGETACVIGF